MSLWRDRCGILDGDFIDRLAVVDPTATNSAAVFMDRGPEWLWAGNGYRLVKLAGLAGRLVDDVPNAEYGAMIRGRFSAARLTGSPMATTVWGEIDGRPFEYVAMMLPMRAAGYDAVLSVGAHPAEYGRT